MKSWTFRLIVVMVVTVAANLLFAGVAQAFHFEFWSYTVAILVSIVISLIVIIWIFDVPCSTPTGGLLLIMLTAISFSGYKWCFDSADETIHLKDMKELLAMPEKPIYFTLDDYKYNANSIGHVRTESKSKSRGGQYNVTSIYYYGVAPLYTDSMTEEAKVWIATEYRTKPEYEAYISNLFTLKPDEVIAFELLNEDLYHYKDALADSPHKNKGESPIFIAPVYKQYITKSTWGMYFLISLAIGTAVMVLIGAVLDWKQKRKAEKGEKIA